METTIQDGFLVIKIPISPARPSASGKTMVVATTGGFAATTVLIGDKPVRVNVTATIPK